MNKIILLLLFLSLAGFSNGENKTNENIIIVPEGIFKGFEYVGEVDENNLPHGKGELKGRDEHGGLVTAKGDFVHGNITGKSDNWVESSGMRYIGEMKNNKMDGYGVFIVAGTGKGLSGYRYEGNWKNNSMHGEGIMTYSDGSYVKGTYVENQLQGFGVEVIKDQYTYYGEYEKDRRTIGYMRWANGTKYVGEWKRGYEGKYKRFDMQGLGILTSSDGKILVGEFKDGEAEGFVATKVPDDEHDLTYIGERLNGKANGIGYMEIKEKEGRRKYLGNFLDNKKHGQGMKIIETGEPVFGVWEDDKLIRSE